MENNFTKKEKERLLDLKILFFLIIFFFFAIFLSIQNKGKIQKREGFSSHSKTPLPSFRSFYFLERVPLSEGKGSEYYFETGTEKMTISIIFRELVLDGRNFWGYQIKMTPQDYFIFWEKNFPENILVFSKKENEIKCESKEILETPLLSLFTLKLLENKYSVPSSLNFLEESDESLKERKIKVLKFKNDQEEIWLSSEIPFYYFLLKRKDFLLHLLDVFEETNLESIPTEKILQCLEKEGCLDCDKEVERELYCEKDSDCVCGEDLTKKECTIGNKNYVIPSTNCKDFCYQLKEYFEIKCESRKCIPIFKTFSNETD